MHAHNGGLEAQDGALEPGSSKDQLSQIPITKMRGRIRIRIEVKKVES